jgi:chromosome segregation protein
MDITKLTIHGFKSFYEKSVFTFGKNITAIVGPNGSGKSNITEGIRFVLGEQGAKAMRGKDITDMLFRGGNTKASKAKVEIVFKKSESFKVLNNDHQNIFIKNALEKDEVVISRTLFADGKSVYEMNGVEVRQKDIQEFLLYVHLGNKSSWHISQGEADRVLSANALDRKTLIEDALGLKVYHARINESQRKLEKTRENIREASLQRKEIMPELSMLARTVDKIKRSSEFRTELTDKAKIFISYRKKQISNLKALAPFSEGEGLGMRTLKEKLHSLESEIGQMQAAINRASGNDEEILQSEIVKEERILNILQEKSLELKRDLQNSENIFNYSSLEEEKVVNELKGIEKELGDINASGNDVIFSEGDVNDTKDKIEQSKDVAEADLNFKKLLTRGSVVTKDNVKQISYLQSIRTRLQEKLQTTRSEKDSASTKIATIKPQAEQEELKLKLVNEKIADLQKQILEFKYIKVEREKDVQTKIFERSNLQIKITELQMLTEKINESEKELEREVWEFENILGSNALAPLPLGEVGTAFSSSEGVGVTDEDFHQLRRSIERLKLRLEESIVPNPDEVLEKHKFLTERDEFLLKEISDLENSMVNLETLISDLKKSLTEEFDRGLEQINGIFDSYVKRLFGGGGAKVYVVDIENKMKKDEEGNDVVDEQEVKTGVEVEVEIPKKKIKGLHSLSGGERALVSIALNFSIINQNPAPFMILDETDAALDEANSKRYGEMLDMLKAKTKLIVVTHNRETMHFADQIFGVTLHKDGHSKILSVSFDDAVEWAK